MGKGEIACYEQFLLFQQCFQKVSFNGTSKGVIVWEWVNTELLFFLSPQVLTAQEIQQQKEDQMKNSNIGVQSKDPYKDRTKLDKFVTEVEKLAKFIEGYEKPSCSGPTPLDSVFKVYFLLTLIKKTNPFPNKPWFLHVFSTSLLKTLREKKKWLVMSNFSLSHSVFYPFGELSTIFIEFKIINPLQHNAFS